MARFGKSKEQKFQEEFTNWLDSGTPPSRESLLTLAEVTPGVFDARAGQAPEEYPDGNQTYLNQHIKALAPVMQQSLADGVRDGDLDCSRRIYLTAQYLAQLDKGALTLFVVENFGEIRRTLDARGRTEHEARVAAIVEVCTHWWKLTGQWDEFQDQMVAANTTEAVQAVEVFAKGTAVDSE